nr:MAG TPA: hypothetical protein [Caudoviricetes sp.]
MLLPLIGFEPYRPLFGAVLPDYTITPRGI